MKKSEIQKRLNSYIEDWPKFKIRRIMGEIGNAYEMEIYIPFRERSDKIIVRGWTRYDVIKRGITAWNAVYS